MASNFSQFSKKVVLAALMASISFQNKADAKAIVVSDIDDTIKMTNNLGSLGEIKGFIANKPFKVMAPLYRDLETFLGNQAEHQLPDGEKDVEFLYISAGYHAIFNGDKFVQKNGFPKGHVELRTLKSSTDTFTYKYLTLAKKLDQMSEEERLKTQFIFIGDNASHDPDIYAQIRHDYKINAEIYIRDVQTNASIALEGEELKRAKNINYFLTEKELIAKTQDGTETILAKAIGESTQLLISNLLKEKELLPEYITKTLSKRIMTKNKCIQQSDLVKVVKCRKAAKKQAQELMSQYLTK